MIKFSQEKVLLLHKLITEETGGDPNVRDISLLNSALESAFATFDGQELYPTKQEKGARIGFSLISNHVERGKKTVPGRWGENYIKPRMLPDTRRSSTQYQQQTH